MGRAPCCDKANVKKGPWSPEEDAKLKDYIEQQGSVGNWIALPQKAGLRRCGKSCRLRWLNYLRPNIKHGEFSDDEDRIICSLFANIGSRWSIIAAQLPGRTDNDIKNYWNTKLKKKLMGAMSTSSIPYQKKPHHQATTFPLPSTHNFLSQDSPYSSLLSQISSAYEGNNNNNNSYYNTSVRAFSRSYEPMCPNPNSVLQTQDPYVGPMHGNYNNNNNNLLIFGGEPSCSSSDGSGTTNQIRHCKVEYDQSYFSNNIGVDDQNHKFFISTNEEKAGANDCFSKTPLDYSLEEIKQLISTNSNNYNFFVDHHEIKTEGKN